MKKFNVGTQEFQTAQQVGQNQIASQPKRKLVSLSDFKLASVSNAPEPEPLRKINMRDLVRKAKAENCKNPMFRRKEIPILQDGCIYGHTLRSLKIKEGMITEVKILS